MNESFVIALSLLAVLNEKYAEDKRACVCESCVCVWIWNVNNCRPSASTQAHNVQSISWPGAKNVFSSRFTQWMCHECFIEMKRKYSKYQIRSVNSAVFTSFFLSFARSFALFNVFRWRRQKKIDSFCQYFHTHSQAPPPHYTILSIRNLRFSHDGAANIANIQIHSHRNWEMKLQPNFHDTP